ncbi:hypothetical protein DFP72DRAFT_339525 [Ephemerocybe angulata]|uniref:C2H2-type domain-containing protein n=1 Tax=Ephemerocybe angulata TaxID=980116 RepID=A0A8H6HYB6_9AGAR|nr:hypothetical protein DFP72DRAFT_339525 [Tulosesus angulatus]
MLHSWIRRSARRSSTSGSTIGIRIEGPAETESPMVVSIGGLTADGSHAELEIAKQPIERFWLGTNNDQANFEQYLYPGFSTSPTSTPPCSPPLSSATSSPESGFLGHDFEPTPPEHNPASIPSDDQYDDSYFDLQERISIREEHLPALLLHEAPHLRSFPESPTTSLPFPFDNCELDALLNNSVIDPNSPSIESLFSSPEPSPVHVSLAASLAALPSSPSGEHFVHHGRLSTPVLLQSDLPPLGRKSSQDAGRLRRRAHSSPYPIPHQPPSTEASILGIPLSNTPNSTSPVMDDKRLYDRVIPRHASSSSLSSPRGMHASSARNARDSPEHRPQSPSLVHRHFPQYRSRSRSASPFEGRSDSSGHRRFSSGDPFNNVPKFLTEPWSAPRLRAASFDQPVVLSGNTPRPSSLVRGYVPDDESTSGEDIEMGAPGANPHREVGMRRSPSELSTSSSSEESLPLPPPPSSTRLIGASRKHEATRSYYDSSRMVVDQQDSEEEPGSDVDQLESSDSQEDECRPHSNVKGKEAERDIRRSSYPSSAYYAPHPSYSPSSGSNFRSTTFGDSDLRTPSYHSTTVRHDVQTQFSSRPRSHSHSHSPSREDSARSLSRARYSPTRASPVVSGSHHHLAQSRNSPSSASTHSTSKSGPLRRSRRLSQSPVRQDVETKVEEVVVRLPPQGPSLGKPVPGRSNVADYKSAQPSPWRALEEDDDDDDNDSALECDDDDDDYCDSGSYRGSARSTRRGGHARRGSNAHNNTKPLYGSPLKGSILPTDSASDSKPVSASPPGRASGGPRRSGGAASPSAPRRARGGAPTATSAVPATTGSLGVMVMGGNKMQTGTQYRAVGSKNIDMASEKRRKGEKRYKCDYSDCGKLFTTNQNRQIHQLKHTDVKPYRCSCGYGSAGRSDLRRHLGRKNISEACRELPVDHNAQSLLDVEA